MSKLFNDFPPDELNFAFKNLCHELIQSYSTLNQAINAIKSSEKTSLDNFFKEFLHKFDGNDFEQLSQISQIPLKL